MQQWLAFTLAQLLHLPSLLQRQQKPNAIFQRRQGRVPSPIVTEMGDPPIDNLTLNTHYFHEQEGQL